MPQSIRKAVLPVAGLGTRFLPATKAIPKEMITIIDKPLLQYAIEEAAAAGIEEFILVTGRGKSAIEDHFDHAYELEETLAKRGKDDALTALKTGLPEAGRFSYTRQMQPLGLGHAIWCARAIVGDEPFAILLPDELLHSKPGCLSQMVDVWTKTGGNLVAVMDVPREETSKYGILDVGADDGSLAEVTGLVEKPAPEDAPSTLSMIGRYILQPDVFDHLSKFETGAGGEIQLTDAMAKLIGTAPFHGLRYQGERFDCGNPFGFLQANAALALDDTGALGKDFAAFLKDRLK